MKKVGEVVFLSLIVCGFVMQEGEPTNINAVAEWEESSKRWVMTRGTIVPEKAERFSLSLGYAEEVDKSVEDVKIASSGSNQIPLGEFVVTAYDLSEECCSKTREDPAFGITASGFSLVGLTREEARVVAVDPEIIPLGSRLYIEFEGEYSHFSGQYSAKDTGGLIKGNKLDLFMGDFGMRESHQSSWDFGVRNANVFLIVE